MEIGKVYKLINSTKLCNNKFWLCEKQYQNQPIYAMRELKTEQVWYWHEDEFKPARAFYTKLGKILYK